ncbi:flagellar hook-length control protein FliK [Aneurinibacillus terranovensis]|uniref:flagellar hook-length control protein FliK n=1 Tax=Aneurinibacillus terranovensis TaxID=278991 RepID=UPI0004291CF3|nr:flagellar hook-length control protein FliK [Aneurinibacillus terranovensis]
MQITDRMYGMNQVPTTGKANELRQDQVVTASIKQKLSSNEAVIDVQGQEYKATFDHGVPPEQQVDVKILGRDGESLQVHTLSNTENPKAQNSSESRIKSILDDYGVKATPEMKKAVMTLLANRVPISKETMQNVQEIIQKGEGTINQKLEILNLMGKKQISITPKSYESVFRTLNGPALDHILEQLIKEAPDSLPQISGQPGDNLIVKQTTNQRPENQVQNSELIQKLARLVLDIRNVDTPRPLSPVTETLERLGSVVALANQELASAFGLIGNSKGETQSLTQWGSPPRSPKQIVADLVQTLRKAAAEEGVSDEDVRKMERILQQVEAESTRLPKPNRRTDSLTLPDDNSQTLQQHMVNELKDLEQMFIQSGERAAALTSVQSANFERVSQYIPDRLREVGSEFNKIKSEIINNVSRMGQFLEKNIPQASSYIQRIIEPTIEMVDRLVTKGEFAMFADMGFEHDVLRISGELQQVKGLLEKGKQGEALQSFQHIRTELEKLNWQPSYTKVERVFSKMTGDGSMQNPFQGYGRDWQQETLSGRGVQEWMRGMGLNHERDALEWMIQREGREAGRMDSLSSQPGNGKDGGGGMREDGRPPQNFKSMLIEGMDSAVSIRAKELMEQALSNVTGQQLLSKQEPGNPVQSLYAQIPLPWEEGTKAVKVHVQSRTNGTQMDWENSSLYFLLDTPKYGETGIGITVVNREMAVRIQNDHPDVQKAFEPYLPRLKEELQGIGYRMNGITFGSITTIDSNELQGKNVPTVDAKDARTRAIKQSAQEGIDFSV